jgi:hypothetical protein
MCLLFKESISTSLVTSPIGSPPLSPLSNRTKFEERQQELLRQEDQDMPITLTSKLEELILRDQAVPQVANASENEAKGQSIPITITNGLDPFSEESIQFGSLDTTLEELGRRSPPLPTSPPPEPQQTVSWRWGALPKVRY